MNEIVSPSIFQSASLCPISSLNSPCGIPAHMGDGFVFGREQADTAWDDTESGDIGGFVRPLEEGLHTDTDAHEWFVEGQVLLQRLGVAF